MYLQNHGLGRDHCTPRATVRHISWQTPHRGAIITNKTLRRADIFPARLCPCAQPSDH